MKSYSMYVCVYVCVCVCDVRYWNIFQGYQWTCRVFEFCCWHPINISIMYIALMCVLISNEKESCNTWHYIKIHLNMTTTATATKCIYTVKETLDKMYNVNTVPIFWIILYNLRKGTYNVYSIDVNPLKQRV